MRRMSWVWLLVVGMLSWTIGMGQAREIALVTDLAGQVEVTVGSGPAWSPQIGETLPEGAVIKVPAGGLVKLFHLGMNRELTLPEKAEATLQAAGLASSLAYEEGAALAALPGSLSLEAASQQQLGAVNPQRMDSPAPPPPPAPMVGKAPEPVKEEPSREPPTETGDSGLSVPDVIPGGPGTGNQVSGAQGSASDEGADRFAPQARADEPAGDGSAGQSHAASPLPSRSRAIGGAGASPKEREAKASPSPIRLALPRGLLPPDLALGAGVPMEAGGKALPPLQSAAEFQIGSLSWVILTGTVPASDGPATVSIVLIPPHRLAGPIDPEVPASPVRVMTALRLEATGCRAQAAAVWVDLARAGTVSQEIAGRHLDRLAAALAKTGH